MDSNRIYDEARKAIQEHRWLESEKAGYDVGPHAAREWARSHWLTFYRSRFVEHLRGQARYEEFGPECFGIVSDQLGIESNLLDRVLDRIRHGAENLDVLCWAMQEGLPRDSIVEILRAVDINSRRLAPPVESPRRPA